MTANSQAQVESNKINHNNALIEDSQASPVLPDKISKQNSSSSYTELFSRLDEFSLEDIVEHKISRFLEKLGQYYPEDLHSLIIQKVEKPLIKQILLRTGGNQVHAARILGINRNTLRKKIKIYSL